MKHIITIDIDGTILNKHGKISKYTYNVIHKLIDLGHIVVLATGRPLSGAISIYNDLGLKTPIITDNGACIDHPLDEKFIKQRTYMPLSVMHDLFKHAKPWLKTAFFNIEKTVYAYQYDPRLEAIFSGLNQAEVVEKDFDQIFEQPSGLIFLINPEYKHDLETYIQNKHGQLISYRLWGEDHDYAVYEIYLKHVSKSSAISYLLNYYQIDRSKWIAFGDGINDIEMISDAFLGVAMKNAYPELLSYCDDMTSYTHVDDGVAKYLVKYFKLNE